MKGVCLCPHCFGPYLSGKPCACQGGPRLPDPHIDDFRRITAPKPGFFAKIWECLQKGRDTVGGTLYDADLDGGDVAPG